ncbi:MAG: DUF6455 family protein [Pseudomonadota bacterium]
MDHDRLKRHAMLVDRMAEARGIDLQEAVMRSGLTPDDVSDMVLTCAGCTKGADCEKWMNDAAEKVSETPSYCRNADVFARLAAE